MAKKINKLMLFGALAGAVAAGTYYYLKGKNNDSLNDIEDLDDFDGFDEDLDDDLDLSSNTSDDTDKNRPYVSINLENAKEKTSENIIESVTYSTNDDFDNGSSDNFNSNTSEDDKTESTKEFSSDTKSKI